MSLPEGAHLFAYHHPEYYTEVNEVENPDMEPIYQKVTVKRNPVLLEIIEGFGEDDPMTGTEKEDMDQWLRDHTGYMSEYEEVKFNKLHGPAVPATSRSAPGVKLPDGPWALLRGIQPDHSNKYVLARFEALRPQGQHPSSDPEKWKALVSDGGEE